MLVVALAGAAQDAPGGGAGRSRYFGAPVLRYTVLRDQGALMFGGRGGWYVARSWAIGAAAFGTISEVDAPAGALAYVAEPLDLKFETFGLEVQYALAPEARVFPTFGLFVGGGAVHFTKDGTSDQQDETDFVYAVEPSAGVELGITDWLHLHLAASYRLVNGVEQPKLANRDFAGPAVTLALELGRF